MKENSPNKITKNDVTRMSQLAELKLNASEQETLIKDFNSILGFFHDLNTLDTSNVTPMSHPQDLSNAFREDVVGSTLTQDHALDQTTHQQDGQFKVPAVLD